MTIQLLSVLSAAALVATGIGTTGETRSAQSLPTQNLALVQAPAGSAGKFHTITHLTDAASTPSDEGKCKSGHWDSKKMRCVGWWMSTGAQLLIGVGTVTGIVLAVSDSGTGSSHQSVSN